MTAARTAVRQRDTYCDLPGREDESFDIGGCTIRDACLARRRGPLLRARVHKAVSRIPARAPATKRHSGVASPHARMNRKWQQLEPDVSSRFPAHEDEPQPYMRRRHERESPPRVRR